MAWNETDVSTERVRFIARYKAGDLSFADLCRSFSISRKTGYKWVRRYAEEGPRSLADRSRAPQHHRNPVSEITVRTIIALRTEHPTWGARKIHHILTVTDGQRKPAISTVGDILKSNGLTARRRPRQKSPLVILNVLSPMDSPNAVWCIDFKGWFLTGDKKQCHPFTVTDGYSRMLLLCRHLDHPDFPAVQAAMTALFRKYGLPNTIRSDNGPPFGSRGLGGLTRLSVWFIQLGIRPEWIAPGRPDQNGRHERMHRALKQDTATPPKATAKEQQKAFDRFQNLYNTVRPHEALDMRTPQSVYKPSQTPYPLTRPGISYSQGVVTRRVRGTGYIRWNGGLLFVSETLIGESVALEALGTSRFVLYYGPIPLAVLDGQNQRWLDHKAARPILLELLQEQDRP